MNSKTLISIFILLGLSTIVFYAGYTFGYREKVNAGPDNISLESSNGATQNFLTKIDRRDVLGSVDSEKIETFGEMLFIITENGQTQILINLKRVPQAVKQTQNKAEKRIPNELNISLARRSKDGVDFEYQKVGTFVFDEPDKDGLRGGRFSAIIPESLIPEPGTQPIQRIVLLPTNTNDENIFREDNPDLPANVRNKPAPYFWVVI